MKRRIFLFLILAAAAGCARPVAYNLSARYMLLRPSVVAVMPVEWEADIDTKRRGVDGLLRTIVIEKLKSLNYQPLPVEEVDKRLKELKDPENMAPHELAGALNGDSVLYVRITEWDEKLFVTYASLKVGVDFELYSATGERLWQAGYITSESDIRLDRTTMELAVIETFEPRLERLVDLVFATLPRGVERVKKKRFFDWLP